MDALFCEVATVFDLKTPFFQVSLPQGSCASFRCRTETGGLVELKRLQMGYKPSPEILHTVGRALAGDPEVVSSMCATPRPLKIHAWIDNVRISGPRQEVEKWGRAVPGI
ncbi:hypothetical protein TRVL_09581 [Trypanosoma vivax]|nr:hypothetical protein TRVL_09581 [Trypanosoma vivax]